MENARKIWQELELPTLQPREPWFGYELGYCLTRKEKRRIWRWREDIMKWVREPRKTEKNCDPSSKKAVVA